jgi:hypothetical protein
LIESISIECKKLVAVMTNFRDMDGERERGENIDPLRRAQTAFSTCSAPLGFLTRGLRRNKEKFPRDFGLMIRIWRKPD